MTPAQTGKTVQLSVRVERAFADRLEALAKNMSRPGLDLGLADAARMALAEGVEVLEKRAAEEKRRK